jgi:hypothetical protein
MRWCRIRETDRTGFQANIKMFISAEVFGD